MSSQLFAPINLRNVQLKNRIGVSPMCMYSAEDGIPNSWHLVHLGARAVGGAGLVIVEATGVLPEGRISPGCLGLWNQNQANAFKPITEFIKKQGSIAGIQLAHAGRKASHSVSWEGSQPLSPEDGGWMVIGPSAIAYSEMTAIPKAMTHQEILETAQAFADAAKRAVEAGFEVIELHMAHGYLLHEFLSPLSNQRTDEFGGTFENRIRFPLLVIDAVRKNIPSDLPLLVRVSATDWADGGWDLEECVQFVKVAKSHGVDLIDCSSGGNVPHQKITVGPHYQVPFAKEIREQAELPTAAVGLITEPEEAEKILLENQADIVLLGREFLRQPYWPLQAAKKLGVDVQWPRQYERAK